MIDVAAAILENDNGKVLIARRKQGKKLAGYWEFPGGKLEIGETPQECLIRELNEEMNLTIEISKYVGENIHYYEQGPIRLLAYKGKITGGEIKLTDHDEYAWINLQELKNVKLAPADVPFIQLLSN